MVNDSTLNQSINKAQRHYSSLFLMPHLKVALPGIAAMSIVAGLSSVIFNRSIEGLAVGVAFGTTLFAVTFLVDWLLSQVILQDIIFTLRRTTGLSYYSWAFWLFFILLGSGVGLAFGALWWMKFCLLGYATLLTLRTVVSLTVLSSSSGKRLIAIVMEPVALILPFVGLWASRGVAIIDYLPFVVVSPFVAAFAAYLFVHALDTMGKKTYGLQSIEIFKAFMLNWVAHLNAPLESFLEKMGEDADIEASFLKFDSGNTRGAIIVPQVHPGPFKNIGSSLLPSLLKEEYEKRYGGDACVALGLLGHELDAASQIQNHKIINAILESAKLPASIEQATPFVRVSEGFVSASCQVFGKTALLSFTLAPKTTEDLPQELGGIVREEAQKLGLDTVVINAHNSLTQSTVVEASLEQLKDVAAKSLQKAAEQGSHPFQVGTATVYPSEYSLADGMGTGGITALVVKVGDQKTAYVVVDGNNMVSGLREKILSALTAAGFEASEVFTTDTHAVSALTVGQRGYHPVGEAMDHQVLLSHIAKVARAAVEKLDNCKAISYRLVVSRVRVIGEESLSSITVLIDKTIHKAKRIAPLIFGLEGLLLVLLLSIL